MLDRQEIHNSIGKLASPHLGRNIREFRYQIIDNYHEPSALLGMVFDHKPFEGKIVTYTDTMMLVKISLKEFRVIDLTYVTEKPAIGSKILVTPYARRNFNQKRIDEPEKEIKTTRDGSQYVVTHHVLGGKDVELPLPITREDIQCDSLKELINQLEQLPAPDGLRKIAHVLVDAGATDFTVVDPAYKNIVETPPSVSFTVDNPKCCGRVAINYDRCADAYDIEHTHNGQVIKRLENLYFVDLASNLVDLIDDGAWQQIHIEVLKKSKTTH